MQKITSCQPVKRLLAIFAMLLYFAMVNSASIIPIADDILTFSDGTPSVSNPDVCEIDKGNFTPGQTYTITVNRPKGAQANYPVSIDYEFVYNAFGCFQVDEQNGVLEFAAGEVQKTLQFQTVAGSELANTEEYVYLFFGMGNRTKAQYEVIKIKFTNPNPVTPVVGNEYDNEVVALEHKTPFSISGSHMLLTVGSSYFGHIEVLDNTQLSIDRWYINHELYPPTVIDTNRAIKQTVYMKPEQSAGTQTMQVEFLYKITEDAIINNYGRNSGESVGPCFTRHADSIMSVKTVGNDLLHESLKVEDENQGMGDAMPILMTGEEYSFNYIQVPPRFGVISTDANTYDRGETVLISIPVLNSKLLEKLFPNNAWLDKIDITLDGGQTFLNRAYITFDAATSTINVIAQASNEGGESKTVVVEILYHMSDGMTSGDFYIYDAYATFTVTAQNAEFCPITSFDFVLPQNNQVNVNQKNIAFQAKVNPINATYKTGTWTSSDPSVGEISSSGVFTPKAYGKTTITFTSEEVEHRLANSMQANDELLIQSFDIYVVGALPEWSNNIPGKSYSITAYDDPRIFVSHNLKENSWKVDGEIAVKVIHADSDDYESSTDAFEATPYMIDEFQGFIYKIPFNEKTFPKEPTCFERETFSPDSIYKQPYRVVMSVPLKQTIGDAVMTTILKDTFDIHMTPPRQPKVTLLQDIPDNANSGDRLTLKYEVKYLHKHMGPALVESAFTLDWEIRCLYSNFSEGDDKPTPQKGTFRHAVSPFWRDYLIEQGLNMDDPASPPDWLELTDMGGYYNAVLTIEYVLPKPAGELKSGWWFDAHEMFEVSVDIYNVNEYLTTVDTKGYSYRKNMKSYTVEPNLDNLLDVIYHSDIKGNEQTFETWERKGYDSAQIESLVTSCNQSGEFDPLTDYLQSVALRFWVYTAYIKEPWDNLLIGLTERNSNDTIYQKLSQSRLNVQIPHRGGEYDLILKYLPKNEQKVFTYRSDSLTNQLHLMWFTGPGNSQNTPFDLNAEIEINYMNGDSTAVTLIKPGNGSPYYAIYEPKGFIGNVSYRQYVPDKGVHTGGMLSTSPDAAGFYKWYPVTYNVNIHDKPSLNNDQGSHIFTLASRPIARIQCSNWDQESLRITLVDEDTGEKITNNAHINYVSRLSELVGIEDEFMEAMPQEEYYEPMKDFPGVSVYTLSDGRMYYGVTDEGSQYVSTYNNNEVKPKLVRRHISSYGGEILTNSEGKVDTGIEGEYIVPIEDVMLVSRRMETINDNNPYSTSVTFSYTAHGEKVMEVIVDGYQPRLVIFNPHISANDVNKGLSSAYIPSGRRMNSGEQRHITIPVKKANTTKEEQVLLWLESPKVDLFTASPGAPRYTIDGYEKSDLKDLTTLGSNSVTSYSRYANKKNAVLNVTLPLENGVSPEDIKLSKANKSIEPLSYHLISPTGYTGFENSYANLSYRLNDLIDYQEIVHPIITYNDEVIAEIPGLFNDEVDPAIYAKKITQELVNNMAISPEDFDISSFGKEVDLQNTSKAMKRAESFDFSMPDPIPFTFHTRTEDNRFYVRGVASHNFINDIPIIGQANMVSEFNGRLDEFDAAFNELKGALKMRPKYTTPRTNSVNAFAGVRGYLEGFGQYNPYNGEWSYGINEGGISIELSANAWVSVPIGPLKMGVGVNGLVSTTMGLSRPSDEDLNRAVNKAQFDLWLESELSLDVMADVSAGIDIGIAGAKVGVRGKGGFSNKNKLIVKPYLDQKTFNAGGMFNVYANMYAYAHAYFLFWSWEDSWKIFDVSKTWYYPDNSDNPYKSAKLRSLPSVYKRSTLALPGSIISDVAANADPRYFDNGNSLLYSNLKSVSDKNDDRLSVYSSGNTSDLLAGETLPMFGFDVASSSSGTTVAAFEQLSESIAPAGDNVSQESYIKAQAANVDVYAAIKKDNVWQKTKLSDVEKPVWQRKTDMQPKTAVSSDGKTAAVVWKSGLASVDNLGTKLNGDLLFSRYDGTNWSKPITLMSADNLGDYSLAIDGDSVVVAAMRAENVPSEDELGKYDVIGKIKMLFVSSDNTVTNVETNLTGRKPQIASMGDYYYVSFMSSYAQNDATTVNDVYMLPVSKNGQPKDDVPSGFAGMANQVSFDYKLLDDQTATSIDGLAILYNASKVVGEGDVETSLYAAKFGAQDNKIYASEPKDLITLKDDGTQLLTSFDGYKLGNDLKVAAAISNESHGAIVVEENMTFENRISCLSEAYNLSEANSREKMNLEFYVLNSGYLPITSFDVSLNGNAPEGTVDNVLPGKVCITRATYVVPKDVVEPVNYTITANFADGSTHATSGTLDLTAYQMNVNLVSLKTTKAKNTAVVEVVNTSNMPFTAPYEVTVGIYKDIFGEQLYPGTTLKTLPAADLYGDDGSGNMINKVGVAGFDIPVVKEVTSVYAIAKVKKNNVLRSANGTTEEAEDVEQPDKTYASIQLFPVKSDDDIPTGLKKEEEISVANDAIRVYPNPTSGILNIKYDAEKLDKIEVVDLSGRLLIVKNNFTGKTLDVSTLLEGMYLLKLTNGNETVTLKFNKK